MRPSASIATRSVTRLARVVAIALTVGFLTGFLGVGGGFLIVPALVLTLGLSMPVAVGTSLVIIVITTSGAFLERVGSSPVAWHVVVPFTVAAIAAMQGLGNQLKTTFGKATTEMAKSN